MPKFQPKDSTNIKETLIEVKRPEAQLQEREAFISQFIIEELPSQFKPYPENTRIIVDTYSYREIKLFSDSRIPLDKQYEIMLQGIHCDNMNPLSLTYFDFIYIGVLRRLSSLGVQRFRAPYYCPYCENNGTHYFDLSEVGFESIKSPELPINVEFNSIGKQSFTPLTVGDYVDLYYNNKLYEKKDKEVLKTEDGTEIIDSIAIISKMCISEPFEKAYDLFYNLRDFEDRALLSEMDELMDHGILPLKFKCNQPIEKVPVGTHPSKVKLCNKKLQMGLSGGESLIYPFREHEQTVKHRISFGNERSSKPT